jgi:hypothetical protein
MRESNGIDSIFRGGSMPKPCSSELRERVVEAVESGVTAKFSPQECANYFRHAGYSCT